MWEDKIRFPKSSGNSFGFYGILVTRKFYQEMRNNMNLPQDFTVRMQQLLGDEWKDFEASYQQEKAYGLRINPLKYTQTKEELPFTLEPVSWAKEGFYAEKEEKPGRHPLHEAGAYYIQEPSAMSVVSLLDPHPGDFVCDLCAAPGGKSSQIAGRLLGEGLLLSNEIFTARAKILSQNMERMGVSNAVVCNESLYKLAKQFPSFFDRIVVDAPCSGEGMFRKDDTAIEEWSLEHVTLCSERQKMILEHAAAMLKPNGVIVYSTCTFAPEEDEQMAAWFLETHPNFVLEDWRNFLPTDSGLENGRVEFLDNDIPEDIRQQIHKTLRLWPHKLTGEGHFAARFRKLENSSDATPRRKKAKREKKMDLADYKAFCESFLKESTSHSYSALTPSKDSCYHYFGDELYLLPMTVSSLNGLKLMRAGLHLGTRKKNRFEPAHALAMALHPDEVCQSYDCTKEDAIRYQKGETISCPSDLKSWTLLTYHGVSLGWGKAQNGILKNHYPKGLRIMG